MKSPFFTEEHHVFRESVRQFIEAEILPHIENWEQEERIPQDIWQLMGENYLLGINFPEQFGGSNADFFYSISLIEELARASLGFTAAVNAHQFWALQIISEFGSALLKEIYLGPGIQGEKISAVAIAEPNTGSDMFAMQTTATRDGSNYILNGQKTFVTNGQNGDCVIVAARTMPETPESGISLFVLNNNSPGVQIHRSPVSGWRYTDTAELKLENVTIPSMYLVGDENFGYQYIAATDVLARMAGSITATAGANYCLEQALSHIENQDIFDQLLSSGRPIHHSISDQAAQLEAAQQLAYYSAWRYNSGLPSEQYAAMANLYSGEILKQTAGICQQLFEQYGYPDDPVISGILRDAQVTPVSAAALDRMREEIPYYLLEEDDESEDTEDYFQPEEDSLLNDAIDETIDEINGNDDDYEGYSDSDTYYDEESSEPASADAETLASDQYIEEYEADEEYSADEAPRDHEPAAPESDHSYEYEDPILPTASAADAANLEHIEELELPSEIENGADFGSHYSDEDYIEVPLSADAESTAVSEPAPDQNLDSDIQSPSTSSDDQEETQSKKASAPDQQAGSNQQKPEEESEKETPQKVADNADTVARQMEETFQEELSKLEQQEKPDAAAPKDKTGKVPGAENGSVDEIDIDFPKVPTSTAANFSAMEDLEKKKADILETLESKPKRQPFKPGRQPRKEADVQTALPPVEEIARSLPARFRAGDATNVNSTFHFKISAANIGEYTVAISGGECKVENGLNGKADCTIETSDKTHYDMEVGKTNPQIAFMMGKVKTSNVQMMIKFYKLFNKLPET